MLSQTLQHPVKRDIVFFILLLLACWMVGWDSALSKQQSEPHLWRQSDCLSLAMNYAKGNSFFEPEIHSRISDNGTSGKTAAEFPVIYYAVGKIWSVTGMQIWIFRLFTGLLGVIALLCLYRTLLLITGGNWFWSALGPMLLLASPIYVFYGIGFLTNVPAFDCTLIAWYFFVRYVYDPREKLLAWSMLFFTLSVLLKISAFTSFIILVFVFVTDTTGIIRYRSNGKLFRRPLVAAGLLLIPVVSSLLWQLGFVEPYCALHGGRYSFTSPVPVWEYSAKEQKHIWEIFFTYTIYQIFPVWIWLAGGAGLVYLCSQFRKVNWFWLFSIPAMLAGHLSFSLLFFFCLDGHDYYHADVLFLFVLIYGGVVHHLGRAETELLKSRFARFAVVGVTLYALYGSATNLKLRFFGEYGNEVSTGAFESKATIETLNRFAGDFYLMRTYRLVGNELDKRGFADTVPVISINDVSFNSTLVMMHRPGYTNMENWFSDSATTADRIRKGAQLLIVENPALERRGVTRFMGYHLFSAGHIAVYDLRPYAAALK